MDGRLPGGKYRNLLATIAQHAGSGGWNGFEMAQNGAPKPFIATNRP